MGIIEIIAGAFLLSVPVLIAADGLETRGTDTSQ